MNKVMNYISKLQMLLQKDVILLEDTMLLQLEF